VAVDRQGRLSKKFVRGFLGLALLTALFVGAWLFVLDQTLDRPPARPEQLAPDDVESAAIPLPALGARQAGECFVRVLSIDGGGVRGLIPALILAEIEKGTGKPIAESFDLIVGTSTGAILALGLTRPSDADAAVPEFSAERIAQFFREDAATIFPNSYSLLRSLK
jgi:patatin-like phospholipase